jgi:hypothetical protein
MAEPWTTPKIVSTAARIGGTAAKIAGTGAKTAAIAVTEAFSRDEGRASAALHSETLDSPIAH